MAKKAPQITKEILTQSALNVLSNTSYKASRLEDIAREVNMTRGAIYWHFANKLALYRHILDQSFNYSMKDLFTIFDSDRPVMDKLESGVEYLLGDKIEIHTKSALIYNNLLLEKPAGLEEDILQVENWFNALFEKHTRVLQEGIEQGVIRDDINPDFQARGQYNFIWGYYTNRARFFQAYESTLIIEYLKKMFIYPLKA